MQSIILRLLKPLRLGCQTDPYTNFHNILKFQVIWSSFATRKIYPKMRAAEDVQADSPDVSSFKIHKNGSKLHEIFLKLFCLHSSSLKIKITSIGITMHFQKYFISDENPKATQLLPPARPSTFKTSQLIHYTSKSHEIYLKMLFFHKLKIQDQTRKIWT